MKPKTYCPYCGTANLIEKQLHYNENGIPIIECHLCKKIFTDSLLQFEREQIEDLQTTKNNV